MTMPVRSLPTASSRLALSSGYIHDDVLRMFGELRTGRGKVVLPGAQLFVLTKCYRDRRR